MAEQWLSIVEYARTFNVSDMTVRRRIKTGRITAVLRDGKYFIPVEAGMPELAEREPEPAKPVTMRPSVSPYSRPAVEKRTIDSQISSVENKFISSGPDIRSHRPSFEASNTDITPKIQGSISDGAQHLSKELVSKVGDMELQMQQLVELNRKGIGQFASIEASIEGRYRSDIITLEARLKNKDLEIEKLSQKIEDLQLLISILEKRHS